MDRGPGFYKLDELDLLCGPNFVKAPSFSLFKDQKDDYIYPVEGWYWFGTESAARVFFELTPLEINNYQGDINA